MKRLAEQYLSNWISSQRRKPLVLRGARQVGKSTLIRQFARQKGLVLNEVNLERHLSLDKVFASLNIKTIRSELEAITGRSILTPGSLLFLDEVQATPSALQALRYFYEEMPDLPVIAAGSLLEFILTSHKFSMPVGRIQYCHLGPMNFREYLEALNPALCQYLDDLHYDKQLPESAHKQLVACQRQYFFTGGMPEAVLAYQETGSHEESAQVHRNIINTYEDDFAKYARQQDLALLQRIFRQIPRMTGQKVKYVNFSREERSRDVKAALNLLGKAHICCPVYASHCKGIPLFADIDENSYKLLFLYIGLMNHVCGIDWRTLQSMDNLELINKGALAEQYIGQHMAYPASSMDQPHPVYWIRESRAVNAEVDYVISNGQNIYPIEVKAGKSGRLRSLQQFCAIKKSPVAVRFDLNQPSRQQITHQVIIGKDNKSVTFELISLPLYAVTELERILTSHREPTHLYNC